MIVPLLVPNTTAGVASSDSSSAELHHWVHVHVLLLTW